MQQAKLVLDCANLHGESVFWNPIDECVWWSDVHGQKIWSYSPALDRSDVYDMPDRVCSFAPRACGGFIMAFADRISLYDLAAGEMKCLSQFEPDNPNTRLNDGRTDRQGNFVVGGMNDGTGEANSSVIRVSFDLSITTLLSGVSCANSTCFSFAGETMFFADTPDSEIVAFDYDSLTGSLSNRRVHASFANEPGLPDGSCIDSEGGVWNAEWEGHRVVRIAPDGDIDQIIDVPVWKPTCCAFGGEDLDTLFITTSCLMSTSDQIFSEPGSGGLFAIKTGFRGLIDQPFAG